MTKAAIAHLKSDPILAAVINRTGVARLKPRLMSPFRSLVHAIIHQQLSGAAANAILGRFQSLFGNVRFPSPVDVAEMELTKLRTAGLSRSKAMYIKDIAQKVLDGIVPSLTECHRLTDDEIIRQLTIIKGVGRWTVEMFLIFNIGRQDVLPVHDLGVRRGYQLAYKKRNLPEPEQLQRIGARWAPFRTTAALYLWRTADFLKDGDW